MNQNVMLIISSLLSILLFTFHLTDDIVRGTEPGTLTNLSAIPLFVLWLYGTVVLTGRRSGYIITLLGGLLSLAVPILHIKGRGVGVATRIPTSSGGYFFIWTLFAIGMTGLFSFILSTQGLWRLRRTKS